MSTSEERWADLADRADVPTVAVWTFEGRAVAHPNVLNGRWKITYVGGGFEAWFIVDRFPHLPGPDVAGRSWQHSDTAASWLAAQLGNPAHPPPVLARKRLSLREALALCARLDAEGEARLRHILPPTEVQS